MEVEESFRLLRPYCVKVAQDHDLASIEALSGVINSGKIPDNVLQELHEYIAYPLRVTLMERSLKNEKLIIVTLRCLTSILSKSRFEKSDVSSDLFHIILSILSPPNNPQKEQSDVLAHSVIQTSQTLFNNSTSSCYCEMLNSCLPHVGAFISLLLKYAQKKSNLELQISSLSCLKTLLNDKSDMILREKLEVISPAFLPGVVICMRSIATDDKQHSSLIKSSLEVLNQIICLSLSDVGYNEVCGKESQPCCSKQKGLSNGSNSSLMVDRTLDWYEKTSLNIDTILSHVIKSTLYHENYKIRLTLSHTVLNILKKCHKTLSKSCSALLDVLVGHCGDSYPQVSEPSFTYLTQTVKLVPGATELLEDRIYELATRLPRLLRMKDEEECFTSLKLFSGYLTALNDKIKQLLDSYNHMSRVMTALLQLIELDCSGINIIDMLVTDKTKILPNSPTYTFPVCRRAFINFTDINLWRQVEIITNQLCSHCSLLKLTDYLSTNIHTDTQLLSQSCLLVNTLIYNKIQIYEKMQGDVSSSDIECVHDLLDKYTNLYKDINHTIEDKSLPIKTRNCNTLLMCLLLEGIVRIHQLSGNSHPEFLLSTLYIILECCGNSNPAISQTSSVGLVLISHAFKYSGPSELLEKHSNYLGNIISLNIRRLYRYPTCPVVIQSLLLHCQHDILQHIDYIIIEVLYSIDESDLVRILPLIRVLQTLLSRFRVWKLDDQLPINNSHKEMEEESPAAVLFQPDIERIREQEINMISSYVMEFIHSKFKLEEELRFMNDETLEPVQSHSQSHDQYTESHDQYTESHNQHAEEQEDITPKPPLHIEITLKIVERCKHLVSHDNPKLRLILLDMLINTYHILSPYNKEFLPIVHDTWSGLLPRLSDSESLVVLSALEVLSVLSQLSRDFIRVRVAKDVIPRLTSKLAQLYSTSKSTGVSYKHTLDYKLQLKFLSILPHIAQYMNVSVECVEKIICTYLPYLSICQPSALNQACKKGLMELSKLDPDCLTYHLQSFQQSNKGLVDTDDLLQFIANLRLPAMKSKPFY